MQMLKKKISVVLSHFLFFCFFLTKKIFCLNNKCNNQKTPEKHLNYSPKDESHKLIFLMIINMIIY